MLLYYIHFFVRASYFWTEAEVLKYFDGVRLQFTIFTRVAFRYVCSTVMLFIICENSLLFGSIPSWFDFLIPNRCF